MAVKITPKTMLDSALHPSWFLGMIARTVLKYGIPQFENMEGHLGPPMFSQNAVRNINGRDQRLLRGRRSIRR